MRFRNLRHLLQLSICLVVFIFSHNSLYAQQNVTGKVSGAKDQLPLIGVTVHIEGSSSSVTTLNDGTFSINAKNGTTLTFSMVGFLTKEVKVTNGNIGNVELEEDLKALSSVVVVGYGTQKKVNLTGSIATIDMADKEGQPLTNVVMLYMVRPDCSLTWATASPA